MLLPCHLEYTLDGLVANILFILLASASPVYPFSRSMESNLLGHCTSRMDLTDGALKGPMSEETDELN